MRSISIISPTIRAGGIDVLVASLKRQSIQPNELIIADELYDKRKNEVEEYVLKNLLNVKLKHFLPRQPEHNNVWNLNKALNDAISASTGELLIFLQDYIWIPPDGVEKFVYNIERLGDCLISGCGDIAKKPNRDDIVNLDGKITVFNEPFIGRPEGISWVDYKGNDGMFREIDPTLWEGNWAITTRKIFDELGGYDESYDDYYGCDNWNISERAAILGYKCYLDGSNKCYAIDHGSLFGGRPEHWEERHANKGFHFKNMSDILEGKKPLKCNYL